MKRIKKTEWMRFTIKDDFLESGVLPAPEDVEQSLCSRVSVVIFFFKKIELKKDNHFCCFFVTRNVKIGQCLIRA